MTTTVPTMQELLEAGVHFGHKVSRGHPKMKPFIYGAREGVHIIDLAKSEEYLKTAIDFAFNLGKSNKTLLVVATKKQAKEIVDPLVKDAGSFYVTSHWVGGILTNFDEIRKNFNKLISLQKEQDAGQLKRYTKKEQLLIARKLKKFSDELGGVADMTKMPDALFIVDAVIEDTAVKEAIRMNIPMAGFSDTNSNPNDFAYPIPANDDGIKAIKIICDAFIGAYKEGRKIGAANLVIEAENKVKAEEAAKVAAAKALETPQVKLDPIVAEQAAVIEEEIEKATIQDSERKVV